VGSLEYNKECSKGPDRAVEIGNCRAAYDLAAESKLVEEVAGKAAVKLAACKAAIKLAVIEVVTRMLGTAELA